jgi:AbrB family looped-hinge helix DNA binding protein
VKIRATAKGRITIPCLLRRAFGIKAGTRIEIAIDEGEQKIILTPITRKYVHKLRGKYRGKEFLKALATEKGIERQF